MGFLRTACRNLIAISLPFFVVGPAIAELEGCDIYLKPNFSRGLLSAAVDKANKRNLNKLLEQHVKDAGGLRKGEAVGFVLFLYRDPINGTHMPISNWNLVRLGKGFGRDHVILKYVGDKGMPAAPRANYDASASTIIFVHKGAEDAFNCASNTYSIEKKRFEFYNKDQAATKEAAARLAKQYSIGRNGGASGGEPSKFYEPRTEMPNGTPEPRPYFRDVDPSSGSVRSDSRDGTWENRNGGRRDNRPYQLH